MSWPPGFLRSVASLNHLLELVGAKLPRGGDLEDGLFGCAQDGQWLSSGETWQAKATHSSRLETWQSGVRGELHRPYRLLD